MNTRSLLSAAVCLLAPACGGAEDDAGQGTRVADSGTAARPAHHFTVDSSRYTLRADGDGLTASIGYVFRNPLPDTVYVVNCNGHVVMDLQKQVPSGWEYVWRGMTNACLSDPLIIAPGDSLAGRFDVWGALPGNASYPTFDTAELDGVFRLAWHQPRLHYSLDGGSPGDTLPATHRYTEPFELQVGP